MQSKWNISFENIGTSSYLTVTFPAEAPLVGYQLEMITSNEISHFLAASRRMINGETVIYYNISSKIQLSQILERRKLTRAELICLIRGAIDAVQDGEEYQLPEEGLIMEPDLIYVVPDTCSPSFLYIPTPALGSQGGGLKDMILSLIMHGQIEMSSDNFIQVLLEMLNSNEYTYEKLLDCLRRFETRNTRTSFPHMKDENKISNFSNTAVSGNRRNTAEQSKQDSLQIPQEPELQERGRPVISKISPDDQDEVVKKGRNKKEKKKKIKTEQQNPETEAEKDEFDREKAKKKFLLPQAVIVVALAAMVSFGAFTDENGGIVLNNILAVVLVLAVAEFVLYREVYVNSKGAQDKKSSEKKKKSAHSKKAEAVNRPSVSAGKPSLPKPPKADSSKQVETAPKNEPEQKTVREEKMWKEKFTAHEIPPMQISKETMWRNADRISEGGNGDTILAESEGDTELWDGDAGMEAYLEYYVNGVLSRVILNKPSILIGRLSSQVDFAVSNPKVGKIHAEFLNQNGMIYVKDLNSKNGTYINRNGQRLNSNVPYPLKDNDRISLADSEFTLRCNSR